MNRLTLVTAVGLLLYVPVTSQGQTAGTAGTQPPVTATAQMVDTQGRGVGVATLQQTPHGVLLKLDLKNVTPGGHGLHIHAAGRCDRPSFESAGDHFNPSGQPHGFLHPRGPHPGDLPNIEVPASTQLSVEYLVTGVTLEPGPRSLLDENGSALVIHGAKDDYITEPAGKSGDRLACGPIVRSRTN